MKKVKIEISQSKEVGPFILSIEGKEVFLSEKEMLELQDEIECQFHMLAMEDEKH